MEEVKQECQREPTDKEKQFLAITEMTLNPSLAGKIVYDQPSLKSLLLTRPGLKREIVLILDKAGVTKEKLVGKLGKIIDTEKNNDTVLRALDMGFDLHGAYAPEKIEVTHNFDIWESKTDDELKREIVDAVAFSETPQG